MYQKDFEENLMKQQEDIKKEVGHNLRRAEKWQSEFYRMRLGTEEL